MIEGVRVKKLVKHCDDRGFFAELVRDDEPELLSRFGQASCSMSYPGVIKAFHYHEKQDDLWFFPSGNAQVVLYDLREGSSTKGETDVYYMGEENPIMLLIPKGVAHGYRVLGQKPATILYFTTESYNPKNPDEKRINWDDSEIGFSWETENK
ncbi:MULTISPECIES: dTDP-4-dehydrorhamnose 3,5-epimerase family protein [unclassified Bacillus (in: firmicutes)]|uniref:dTDP-4-dehydrorhamnose 3,5-epimerase family protein n=1 Tax=unclassified Bacillus (in: firmicutes) TaxID=185979 RepID=UPI001BED02F8|nr:MULTISPECIES: dTDP-4-dehydrorhamnose 3,5-epimerase family protein [unclassified Bacillus (in: firmicutes)]MBT2618565.1 dTDP-4-dehydrorhamnose 3,5-epimerase family protein [Bacillus sp. ISL-78]MBT2629164.1 dTDP-4-dehydrorhamnose 3,5-epimerase family protein [Bacillus sp. ISL-101]MBT2717331.1 dTDP-4-dehydrorhamnose 3,5-epimerase family protein [Bacillus sp. ISL-57]